MSRYAQNTVVGTDRSRSEIEKTLSRYGASGFGYLTDYQHGAQILFQIEGRRIRISVPLPSQSDREFTHTPAGRVRKNHNDVMNAWEQACRQRWRALALVVKAKLEAVDAGIATIEEEFMAHILLPSGRTVSEEVAPRIEEAYQTGKMPRLMITDGCKG